MKYIHSTSQSLGIKVRTAVALGNFDGLHLGHQKLIEVSKEYAKKYEIASLVLSFYPHPSHVLHQLPSVPLIYKEVEKKMQIEKTDIDYYVELPFTQEAAKMEPEVFVKKILVEELKCKVVVVGSNYRFGHKRKGGLTLLEKMGRQYDFELVVANNIMYKEDMISSTQIRGLINQGKIKEANVLLGQPYLIEGVVTKGRQLGRTLGFPTINFKEELHKQYPPKGVYVTTTTIDDQEYISVTNVGVNPTIAEDNKLTVESYILGIDQDLYEKHLVVHFYDKIRDEMHFKTLEELIEQMKQDVIYAEQFFKTTSL